MFERVGCVFPGQGSQYIGMGKSLAAQFKIANDSFEESNSYLGFDLKKIIFEGPEEKLKLTAIQQPAILTTSIAIWRVLQQERQFNPIFVAGHSLGEYSALIASEALTFGDGVKLSHLRGTAMQEAVPVGRGLMAAILGLEADCVGDICKQASAEDEIVVPANLNSSLQIVISGDSNAVQRALDLAKKVGAKRAIPLSVSAPFHSPLMKPAAERMKKAFNEIDFHSLKTPYISNVDANLHADSDGIKDRLIEQITAPVLWDSSMRTILGLNCHEILEIGPGNVLTNLFRRLEGAPEVKSLDTLESLLSFVNGKV
ncbi:MAG: [acyl-carrier-protein] S-malonyltransferase [Deltaproteobacteria bacterium RIFCSPHIGHO2_12_FULL_43_9]|nr:MAG: [acyl-carrier-protein] S-malonyltransferase [Deltaproteobacteria bacterium RIFCSPHIGHO2_12_FULL_43_9]